MCSCCNGLLALFAEPKNYQAERERFERIVAFLQQVPLFKTQLPDAELPMVAQHLEMKTWNRGATVVKQGDMGQSFFLILSGEVKAITTDKDGVQRERCRLRAGDYWGGQSLINRKENVADIVASGDSRLVTLSMSRNHFEQLGFMTKLVFPKRPGLHRDTKRRRTEVGGWAAGSNSELNDTEEFRTQDEKKFILDAIHRSPNLRALVSETDRALSDTMAERAERREIAKDSIIAECGEFGEAFYVIASGSVDVMINAENDDGAPRSAEMAVASSRMAERLQRKQHFLQEFYRRSHSAQECRTSRSDVILSEHGHRSPRSPRADAFSRHPTMNAISEDATEDAEAEFNTTICLRRRHSLNQAAETLRKELREMVHATKEDSETELAVGDTVACVLPGELDEVVGIVREIVSPQQVEVIFGKETRHIDAELLRRTFQPDTIARLKEGDSFGELSLIYNVRTEATFKASEECVVYVVHGKAFKDMFSRCLSTKRLEEYASLLDEVYILGSMMREERMELAQDACGFVEVKPHERVLIQGQERQEKLWYVVHRGYGFIYVNENVDTKVRLDRAAHFGERSLLRGANAAEVNVDAGPQGMVVLTFNGEDIKKCLSNIWSFGKDKGLEYLFKPNMEDRPSDWIAWKGKRREMNLRCHAQFEDLVKVDILGHGGFAEVFLVWDKTHEKHYALKRISKGFIQTLGQEVANVVVWERDLMFKVDSPFVVHLYTTFQDTEFVYFLTEALLGGNLLTVLHDRPELFTEDQPRGSNTAFYVACLINGLEHLHQRCIVYRDMKPENVLIHEDGYAKICDMGFARYVLGKTNTMCGTPEYMPPEQIDFPHTHSHSADWWALGVLTYELIVGQPPWDDEGIVDKREKLLAIRRSQERAQLTWPFAAPNGTKSFIGKLLKKLPNRLGAAGGAPDLRQDLWFKSLKFDFDALHRRALPAPWLPGRSDRLDRREDIGDEIRESIFEPFDNSEPDHPDTSWVQHF